MANLQTAGFQIGALPSAGVLPPGIGKFSTQEALQTGETSADFARRMLNAAAQYQADQATLGNTAAQQRAAATTATPVARAKIAEADMASALNSPEVIAGSKSRALAGLDADLAQEQQRRDDVRFKTSLGPANRLILATNGIPTSASTGITRNPDGTTSEKSTKSVTIPGQAPVTVGESTISEPTAPVITPIPGGPGGTALGAAVSAVGPGGKASTEIVHSPLAALNSINTGTTYQKVGERVDEMGNKKDIYQAMTTSAAGGAPKPVGGPIEVNAGTNPSAPGGGQPPPPFISKDAGKAIEEAQAEVQALQQRKVELSNIAHNAEQYIGANVGAGKFLGPIRSFLGDESAQQFTGSVQNALSTALQPLRGTGRVSQTEFNQALSALPTINDQAETIRQKLNYLNLITDWTEARTQAYLKNLGQGMNRYQAFQAAQQATPIPEIPDFNHVPSASAAAAPSPGANPAGATRPTITNQQQYDALPPGAEYLGPDGQPHRKGGG